MKPGALIALAALGSCSGPSSLPAASNGTLDPTRFFAGRTHGEGVLHKLVGKPVRIVVKSVGRRDRGGVLTLDQTITEGAKPSRQRRWIMRPAGPGRFTGTLTDAVGPVDVTTDGTRATIRYRMKGGLKVEQQLALQPDGRTLLNVLAIRKLGLRVARLEETIRKLD